MTSGNYEKHADSRDPSRIIIALDSLYARKLGTTTAVWLRQAEYTQKKAGIGCWWLKKTMASRDKNNQMIPPKREIDKSFEYEAGLTRTDQENARQAARELGVLQERRSHYGGRLEYLIDLDLLAKIVSKWADEERNIQRAEASEITFSNGERQRHYATVLGGRETHMQWSHGISFSGPRESSTRGRSLAFYAFAVLAASRVVGSPVPVFVPENGFICINPPLVPGRVASLSTRTTHPLFIAMLQELLDRLGVAVKLQLPYPPRTLFFSLLPHEDVLCKRHVTAM